MRRYNLIDEKWIPLRMLDGSHNVLGIEDVLLRAKEIEAVEDQSPLVTAAIYRFLLAILYRALEGPTDIDQSKLLFREGFPNEKIKSYLRGWRDRFWLFDEKYPFGQIPTFNPKAWRTWTTLIAEHNADNAKVLFDHVNVQRPGRITEAKAVCGILATQTFALSAGKSELAHTGTAPSAKAMMVLPMGSNLSETLVFSLISINRESILGDIPLWEREPESLCALQSGKERCISGLADLYTWRTRSIRLQENNDGGVENVAFASGLKSDNTNLLDPMVAYKKDDKHGLLPIQFRERGLWRDFDCILPDDTKLAPQVIQHALNITRLNPRSLPRSIMVFGQYNEMGKANIKFWRMERFVMPTALAGEKPIRSDIRNLLNIAEDAQKILYDVCRVFARHLLNRGNREPRDINDFVKQMSCIPLYWSTLEAKFHSILDSYSLDRDAVDVEHEWQVAVKDALIAAWVHHKSTIRSGSVWEILALVKAEAKLSSKLKNILMTIKKYELKEVK